jgi:hypothetical protein
MSVTGDTAAITGDGRSKSLLVHAASYVLWPAILGACIYGVGRGIETGHAAIHFNVTYLCLALGLVALERVLPHERQWLANDGQVGTDLAHTLLNKGFAQVLVSSVSPSGSRKPPRRRAGTCGRATGRWPCRSCSDW